MDNIYYYRKSVIFLIVFSVNIKMNLKSGFKKELKNVFLKGLKKRSFYQMEALSGRRSRINFLISSTDLLLSAFEKYRSVYDRFYFTLILILYCTGKTFRAKKNGMPGRQYCIPFIRNLSNSLYIFMFGMMQRYFSPQTAFLQLF